MFEDFPFFSLNGTVFTAGRVVYSASRHVQINLDFARISNAGGFNNDQSSYQCHVDHSFVITVFAIVALVGGLHSFWFYT